MVEEHYICGDKAVSMLVALVLIARGKWLEKVMSRIRGVSYNFTSVLDHLGVVDIRNPMSYFAVLTMC